jgi:cyanophycinase
MGGGTDQDEAFRWMCAKAVGGPFLILRATGTSAYDSYLRGLCPALSSVETLVIGSSEAARDPSVAKKIAQAGAIFIAGGSQDNYVNFWRGTPVQDGINRAVAQRNTPVGGTSAGLAVLGQYSFAALHDTITSQEALSNPFDERVTIVKDFLRLPFLSAKITDSHFVTRDRMGRLLVFMARSGADGVGIDEKTAVLMESDGAARVAGQGNAYFLRALQSAEVCRSGVPLTFRDVAVYRISAGAGKFNLASWIGSGGTPYRISAVNGVLESSRPIY